MCFFSLSSICCSIVLGDQLLDGFACFAQAWHGPLQAGIGTGEHALGQLIGRLAIVTLLAGTAPTHRRPTQIDGRSAILHFHAGAALDARERIFWLRHTSPSSAAATMRSAICLTVSSRRCASSTRR